MTYAYISVTKKRKGIQEATKKFSSLLRINVRNSV